MEAEGGPVLTQCVRCHYTVKPYMDGLCIFCWLKRQAQKVHYAETVKVNPELL